MDKDKKSDQEFGKLVFEDWSKGHDPHKPIENIPHPKIMDELAQFLEQHGHTCGNDQCSKKEKRNDMVKHEHELENLVKDLRAKGHKCVLVGERFPRAVSWCHQEPCIEK